MRILFFGTGTFAEPVFLTLLDSGRHEVVGLVTNPDRPAGKGKRLEMERGIKRRAVERGVPTFQPERINTPEGAAAVAAFGADLFVTAAYGQILSKEILSLPKQTAINVHGSLLPKYRGAAPVAWAIWRGEAETGVTIIRMSPQMDAGDMLAKAAIPIEPTDTTGSLLEKLAALGAKLALETVDRLAAGPVVGEAQDPGLATKAPKLTKEHGLVDWTQPAAVVERQIRAMQPWPGAYTFLASLRLLILRAVVVAETTDQPPGAVVRVGKNELAVACGGGGMVGLTEVQPDGKKRQPIAAFLSGHKVRTGDRFGDQTTQTTAK